MDRFTVIKLIGEGSYGRVYKATDNTTKNYVALKIIAKRGRSSRELKGLRCECEIQRHLNHPNIIQMLDSLETTNEIVVVTEFAKCDLHTLLAREGSLGEPRTQKLSYDLISALYYLHSHRILHRDLKPQNILLDKNMTAKLCDFGLARNMTLGTHVLTSIKGTPLYMAPELLEAKPYDHQADLWSLGCIIYEMLAGEPPFSTTSILHLVSLIRHEYIKWPSFLTRTCISFLQSLLVKDPTQRMTWQQILNHPFVKGHILILNENLPELSAFTHPLTDSQSREKEKQTAKLIYGSKYQKYFKDNLSKLTSTTKDNVVNFDRGGNNLQMDDNIMCSHDSINAILQSDLEYLETDVEDAANQCAPVYEEDVQYSAIFNDNLMDKFQHPEIFPDPPVIEYHPIITKDTCYAQENPNLIINYLIDNFPQLVHVLNQRNAVHNSSSAVLPLDCPDIDKNKFCQDFANLSLKLESNTGIGEGINKPSPDNDEKCTPPLLPINSSCDESQTPPIENEEWLAFLHKSMQEIFDGELDSLKEQNFVSIIVSPLRNSNASPKVIECVAQILSLPLAIKAPISIVTDIKNVYIEVKLVPNLVYASKLLCNNKSSEQNETPSPEQIPSTGYRRMSSMKLEEVKTLSSLYELVCHLVHSGENFLTQFCDAIAVLGADKLLVNFLSSVAESPKTIRLVSSVLALLCCAIRELPENAELIEKIIFDEKIDLKTFMRHDNALLRFRICMLLRLLGRFSCCALQNNWSNSLREVLETLTCDSNEDVRKEADGVLAEFKNLSFYVQSLS